MEKKTIDFLYRQCYKTNYGTKVDKATRLFHRIHICCETIGVDTFVSCS